MSLVILRKASNVKMPDFFSEIESKTGVKIESTRNSGDTYSDIKKITFTDGNYISMETNEYHDSTEWIVFIDDYTHLFIFTQDGYIQKGSNLSGNSSMSDFHKMFLVDIEGNICDIICQKNFYYIFNFPYNAKDEASKQSIKIVPAFCYYDYNRIGFLKNVYINYERRFDAGLKFVDQNGNRFVTLGSYLLYKVD